MTYKTLQSLLPSLPLPWSISYISFGSLYSANTGLLQQRNSCLRAFALAIPSMWNAPPPHICTTCSLTSFTSQLRESFLITKNSAQTIIPVSLNLDLWFSITLITIWYIIYLLICLLFATSTPQSVSSKRTGTLYYVLRTQFSATRTLPGT